MTRKYPLIAVTLGDPGGIGPEVTVKALARLKRDPLFKKCGFILLGPLEIYEAWNRKTGAGLTLQSIPVLTADRAAAGAIRVLDIETALLPFSVRAARFAFKVVPGNYVVGRVSSKNAFLAYASLRIGAYLASCGLVSGLATAPINKEAMRLMDPGFIGHTEYLAEVARAKEVAMMFDGGKLKVTLVTIHLPLRKVSAALSRDGIFSKIRLTHEFLRTYYGLKRPRLAVAALNPHGREFGTEEDRLIAPAIRKARLKGIQADGPLPGDEVLHRVMTGKYDAAIAMYHDQGLAPLKTVAFDDAVNMTLGLPFIRTSPDHGTAFDIAGRNRANPGSMLSALKLACRLSLRSL